VVRKRLRKQTKKKTFVDGCLPVGRVAFSSQILILFTYRIRRFKKVFIKKGTFLSRGQKIPKKL
jgi:hypothetical protein